MSSQLQSKNKDNNNDSTANQNLLPTRSNVKVLSQTENGDLFLKVFLMDKTINKNKWGISNETVDENIQTVVGRPLVLYQDTGAEPDRWFWPRKKGQYNHPPWDEHDINHSLEMQEAFAVGRFEKVMKNQQTGTWWGLAKITDEGIKKVLRENPTLPFYVSPQIRRLHMAQANEAIRDWIFMHSAIVSVPAFGVQAQTAGTCSGDSESCTRQFLNGSVALSHLPRDNNTGKVTGCGFCTYNAMKEVSKHTIENEKQLNGTNQQINNLNTSHLTKSTNLETEQRLSDNSNTRDTASVGVQNASTVSQETVGAINENQPRTGSVEYQTQNQPQQGVTVEHKTYPQPQSTTIRPNASKDATPSGTDNKLALIARIEQEKKNLNQAYQQINTLARDNQRLASKTAEYDSELASMKNYIQTQQQLARETEIADIVYNANLADLVPEEVKEKQISFLLSTNLSPKQVKEISAPWYSAFDSYIEQQRQSGNSSYEQSPHQVPQQFNSTTSNASLNRRDSRLRIGGAPKEATNNSTFNASAATAATTSTKLGEPAFLRARKLAGMYTPQDDNMEGQY